MSMRASKTGDLAEVGLREAMSHVVRGAAPWKATQKDLQRLKEAFRKDFVGEIGTLEDYTRWAPRIESLFRGAGALAAVAAEARRKTVGKPAGQVKWKDLVLGVQVVRVFWCPRAAQPSAKTLPPRMIGKICSRVPFLQGNIRDSMTAALAELEPAFF